MNNTNKPKAKILVSSVSLAIPLYNNAKTAQKLLTDCYNIMQEMCGSYEIILCDDGSSDGTTEIIQQFAEKHAGVFIIKHQKNAGIAKSLKDLYSRVHKEYM